MWLEGVTGVSFLRDGEKEGKCSIVVLSADNQVLFSPHIVSGHINLTPGLQWAPSKDLNSSSKFLLEKWDQDHL